MIEMEALKAQITFKLFSKILKNQKLFYTLCSKEEILWFAYKFSQNTGFCYSEAWKKYDQV